MKNVKMKNENKISRKKFRDPEKTWVGAQGQGWCTNLGWCIEEEEVGDAEYGQEFFEEGTSALMFLLQAAAAAPEIQLIV